MYRNLKDKFKIFLYTFKVKAVELKWEILKEYGSVFFLEFFYLLNNPSHGLIVFGLTIFELIINIWDLKNRKIPNQFARATRVVIYFALLGLLWNGPNVIIQIINF